MVHLSQNVSQVDPYSELSQVHTYGYTFAHKKQRASLHVFKTTYVSKRARCSSSCLFLCKLCSQRTAKPRAAPLPMNILATDDENTRSLRLLQQGPCTLRQLLMQTAQHSISLFVDVSPCGSKLGTFKRTFYDTHTHIGGFIALTTPYRLPKGHENRTRLETRLVDLQLLKPAFTFELPGSDAIPGAGDDMVDQQHHENAGHHLNVTYDLHGISEPCERTHLRMPGMPDSGMGESRMLPSWAATMDDGMAIPVIQYDSKTE